MSTLRIQILSVEEKSGVSKKTNAAYNIRKAHCILFFPEGPEVGMLQIPKAMEKSPAPGFYMMEFGPAVDFQTRDVGGRVVALTPVADIPDSYIQGNDKPAATGKKAA